MNPEGWAWEWGGNRTSVGSEVNQGTQDAGEYEIRGRSQTLRHSGVYKMSQDIKLQDTEPKMM